MHNNSITYEALSQWFLEIKDHFFPIGLQRLEAGDKRLAIGPTRVLRDKLPEAIMLGRAKEANFLSKPHQVVASHYEIVICLAFVLGLAASAVRELHAPRQVSVCVEPRGDPKVEQHSLHIPQK